MEENGHSFVRQTLLIWMLWSVFFMAGCAAVDQGAESREAQVAEKWGIEITSIRMTAAGHMIDFRYKVLDAAKAESLFLRKNKPYLIDQKTEKVLGVPRTAKVGPLRASNKPQEGRIYWMFFGNGGGLVQSGSRVTVVIGDFRVEDLVVQ